MPTRQYSLADLGADACIHDLTISEGGSPPICAWCGAVYDPEQRVFVGGSIHNPIHPLYQAGAAAAAPSLPKPKAKFEPTPALPEE